MQVVQQKQSEKFSLVRNLYNMGLSRFRFGVLIENLQVVEIILATLIMVITNLNANAISNNAGSFYNKMATSKGKSNSFGLNRRSNANLALAY